MSRQGRTTPSCSGPAKHLLGQSQPKSRGYVPSLHTRVWLPSLMLPEKSEDRHPQHKLTSRSILVKIESENAIKSKSWEVPALKEQSGRTRGTDAAPRNTEHLEQEQEHPHDSAQRASGLQVSVYEMSLDNTYTLPASPLQY